MEVGNIERVNHFRSQYTNFCMQRRRRRVQARVKNFSVPPASADPLKIHELCAESPALTLRCRVTWIGSEKVNLYNIQ